MFDPSAPRVPSRASPEHSRRRGGHSAFHREVYAIQSRGERPRRSRVRGDGDDEHRERHRRRREVQRRREHRKVINRRLQFRLRLLNRRRRIPPRTVRDSRPGRASTPPPASPNPEFDVARRAHRRRRGCRLESTARRRREPARSDRRPVPARTVERANARARPAVASGGTARHSRRRRGGIGSATVPRHAPVVVFVVLLSRAKISPASALARRRRRGVRGPSSASARAFEFAAASIVFLDAGRGAMRSRSPRASSRRRRRRRSVARVRAPPAASKRANVVQIHGLELVQREIAEASPVVVPLAVPVSVAIDALVFAVSAALRRLTADADAHARRAAPLVRAFAQRHQPRRGTRGSKVRLRVPVPRRIHKPETSFRRGRREIVVERARGARW